LIAVPVRSFIFVFAGILFLPPIMAHEGIR
jgi:hypothetical protein